MSISKGGVNIKNLKSFDTRKIYDNWIKNTKEFQCFSKSTNFVTLKEYPDFILDPDFKYDIAKIYLEKIRIILLNLKRNVKSKSIFIFDFKDDEAIDIAFFLRKLNLLNSVLILNGIVNERGIVCSKAYINKLLLYGEQLEFINEIPDEFALVADLNRYGNYSKDELKKYFNNQYEITEDDLPNVEMLSFLGYENIVYITNGKSNSENEYNIKEDMFAYLEHLYKFEFKVFYFDLSQFSNNSKFEPIVFKNDKQ